MRVALMTCAAGLDHRAAGPVRGLGQHGAARRTCPRLSSSVVARIVARAPARVALAHRQRAQPHETRLPGRVELLRRAHAHRNHGAQRAAPGTLAPRAAARPSAPLTIVSTTSFTVPPSRRAIAFTLLEVECRHAIWRCGPIGLVEETRRRRREAGAHEPPQAPARRPTCCAADRIGDHAAERATDLPVPRGFARRVTSSRSSSPASAPAAAARLPERRRRRVDVGVEQRCQHPDPRDPVDDAVVHLHEQREARLARPSMIHASHSGRLRLSGRSRISAQRCWSCCVDPGRGRLACRTWRRRGRRRRRRSRRRRRERHDSRAAAGSAAPTAAPMPGARGCARCRRRRRGGRAGPARRSR